MGKMSFKMVVPPQDLAHLTFGLLDDDKQLGHVVMTADEVERLIRELARMRAQMQPKVPRTVPNGELPPALQDPLYTVPDLATLPGKMLLIRHDGIGWLPFAYTDKEAAKLAHSLLDQSKRPTFAPNQTRQ